MTTLHQTEVHPGMNTSTRPYNGPYRDAYLNRLAFPLGGIGAGMVCLEGTGAISHVSLRHHPDVYHEPAVFSALWVKGEPDRSAVLEGPVPAWKVFGERGTGNGASGKTHGLPRFSSATFDTRFPFGTVRLEDPRFPLEAELTGWSPFTPGDEDASSLPVAALEYRFTNTSGAEVEAVYSFHAANFMAKRPRTKGPEGGEVRATPGGFILYQEGLSDEPWQEGAFAASTTAAGATVDCAWFRGGWFDPLTMVWNSVASGALVNRPPLTEGAPSPGGSLYVPLKLAPGESTVVELLLAWYVPQSNLRTGNRAEAQGCEGDGCCEAPAQGHPAAYAPWYAARFEDIGKTAAYWLEHYGSLRQRTTDFSSCFYDTTLPPEVVEAVAANLTILKSPTVLRQADGQLWAWEGCSDATGCCPGSCTHVWNYAQALPHLFPALERSLRQTEFLETQDKAGHQNFRAPLPIRAADHEFHAAADGQLGGIMKAYREWRISGDTAWLRELWPHIKTSLEYCVTTWDPDHQGVLLEPHHNTYDIEFWGPDGMCSSFYLGALTAAVTMGETLGEDVSRYRDLVARGRAYLETELFDGEYFIQNVEWRNLRAANPSNEPSIGGSYSPEALALLEQEGPKYQYGSGCLSDGILGAWLAEACGIAAFLDPDKVRSHLRAVHTHNLKTDLSAHANPQRPSYAVGAEGGLLLCSWPKGGKPSLPFVYSDEVWTGIEYQVASHLMMAGLVEAGLEVVRACRSRYDGRVRNPFNEYECGHWYARAMASYGLLQGLTGARYDAVTRTLSLHPKVVGDFRAFLAAATGYGTVGVRDGEPFLEIVQGSIPYEQLDFVPAGN